MKLLRETITRLILESHACDNLNQVLQDAIDRMVEHQLEIVYNMYSNKLRIMIKDKVSGKTVGILKADKADPEWDGPCWGGYIVGWAKVEPTHRGTGLGALLYDVALELVGSRGLMADRNSVSEDAIRNWNYFHSRPGYENKPLDNSDGEYTPDNRLDDCGAGAYQEHEVDFLHRKPSKQEFQSMALNQVFVKQDTSQPTITCLQDLQLIR